MTNTHGTPVWYELLATDAAAAQAFYTDVVGWRAADSGMAGVDYRLLSAPDGAAVAGLMMRPPQMPGDPTWLCYYGVDDVDAALERVIASGGAVHVPAMDMPGVGRMALVADPQGHVFYVMRGASDQPSTAFAEFGDGTLGHAVWNELTAGDQDAAMAFYADVLGWRHEGGVPMGPLGDYKFVHAGTVCLGGTMNGFDGAVRGWLPYFQADEIDAAVARIGSAGGRVVQGPDEIPGGSFSVVATDRDGVRFGLVGPRTTITAPASEAA